MSRDQRDHSVAAKAKPVHPIGQPISASTNSGFKVRRSSQVLLPVSFVRWTWRPSRPFTGTRSVTEVPSFQSRAVGVIQSCDAWLRSAFRRPPALGLIPSQAFGVGQPRASRSRPGSSRLAPPRERKLSVCGVGQRRRNSVRLPPLDRVPEQARGVGHRAISRAMGEDEEPFPAMGRADFRRRKQSCRKAVAHVDQISGDLGKSEAEMMGDVFEEDERRPALTDDARNVGPEMPRIGRPLPPARDGEGLARIARKDDVHCATPRAAVEGCDVVPDRRRIQGRVFHPRHEDGCSIGFPLDVTHSAISAGASHAIPGIGGRAADGKMETEVESAGASAERESEQRTARAGRRASGGR